MHTRVALSILTFLVASCQSAPGTDPAFGGPDFEKADSTRDRLAEGELLVPEGSPEAVAVLRFLTSGSPTFELLDDRVRLDRRAAQAIVDHLASGGQLATVGESGRTRLPNGLFDLSYVKNRALGKLVRHVTREGLVPTGDDLLGTWDDVTFTVNQAQRTLRLANEESFGVLDREVRLHRDTALSIALRRPFRTIWELAKAPQVGEASLRQLRDHGPGVDDGRLCRQTLECPSGQRCIGIPYDGSGIHGKCRDLSGVPGAGRHCENDAECGNPELRCLGRSLPWNFGMCMENWMYDTFSIEHELTIDPGDSGSSHVVVFGQATVPLDLITSVDLDLRDVDPSHLIIKLRSPDWSDEGHPTYTSTIWNGPRETDPFEPTWLPEPGSHPVAGEDGIARDHGMNGRYTLFIENLGDDVITLRGWTLTASSNWD